MAFRINLFSFSNISSFANDFFVVLIRLSICPNLSRFCCCLPLLLLLSTCPVRNKFSRTSFLIYHEHFSFPFPIVISNFFVVPTNIKKTRFTRTLFPVFEAFIKRTISQSLQFFSFLKKLSRINYDVRDLTLHGDFYF